MTRRILGKTATGVDLVNFGGEDLDYVNKLLTGIDQSGTDPVDINTTWKFRNGKARIANSGNTQVTIINSAAASTDKTWTLPDATDTAVGLDATQTLTNKTLTTPIITSISNSGTVTIPAGTDTLVNLAGTQTLTGKTISAASNTLTGVVTTSSTDTLTNKTLTAPIISTISNSGTITIPTGTLTLSTLTGTETLTNKTLTSPVIASISNSGTITIPTGTLTLSTLTGTETLTNKSIDANTNTFSNVTLYPDKKLWGTFVAATAAGASAGTSGIFNASRATAPTGQGTITLTVGTSGRFATFPTSTTIDQQAGIRFDTANAAIIRNKNGRIKFRFRINETFVSGASTYRLVLGIHSTTGSYLTGNDPTAAGSGIFLCLRATDTNYVIAHRGTGTSTYDTTAITPDTSAHTFEIKAVTDSEWQWSYDGGAFTSVTSEIPASASNQLPHAYIQTTTANTRTWDLWYIIAEQDP